MELMGICTICGKTARLNSCMICGRLVCSDCMDARTGLCIRCSHGRSYPNIHEKRFE
ncbi:hypothetical protein [Methanosalsum zhilinae]|uniref:hypothetical protein n=1 Tax=Methanosalsum zhilinae TaxID=39669 RepID=UPI0012F6D54D|nr:hypothetical protein [Methanosalsum zhilinae]